MAKQISDNTKKKRGRKVTTGKGLLLGVRVHEPLISALDAWAAAQPEPRPSRPEVIRFALNDWLICLGMLPRHEDPEGAN